MPIASVNGVELYSEDTGHGFPLVWSHEFGGDYRSWSLAKSLVIVGCGRAPSTANSSSGRGAPPRTASSARASRRSCGTSRRWRRAAPSATRTRAAGTSSSATCTGTTLVMTDDQDEPCLEPSRFMRQHIPNAGLVVVPMTGHTVNIEEPALFKSIAAEFLMAVEHGRWGTWGA